MTPKSPGANAWIFTSTYGGGLVDGDAIELNLHAGPNTRCLLTTQASTKVYISADLGCRQNLHVRADAGAVVVSVPDPIACFAGAVFEQRQRFDLAGDASLLMLDWFTSGRKARGERWAFEKFQSCTEIYLDGQLVLRDAILLDPGDGPLAGPMRMGTIDCFATVVMAGQAFKSLADTLARDIAGRPARGEGSMMFSAARWRGE